MEIKELEKLYIMNDDIYIDLLVIDKLVNEIIDDIYDKVERDAI